MKMVQIVCASALVVSFAAMVGCKGSPEGNYKLDKAETKKAMEAEIAKMPAEDKKMAELGVAMIDAMDINLEIKGEGKTQMKSKMALSKDAPPKEETEAGEWRKDGDSIVIKSGKEGKDEMKCKTESGKLNCASGKKGSMTLVFAKA